MEKQTTWQEAMKTLDRAEHAQAERDRSNGLMYSLDNEEIRNYLENQCAGSRNSPERAVMETLARETLYQAMFRLTSAQIQRIFLHFWEEKSFSEIARLESVDESAVRHSVERGLLQLKRTLTGTGISASDFAVSAPIRYIKHRRCKKGAVDRQNNSTSVINFYDGGEQNGE